MRKQCKHFYTVLALLVPSFAKVVSSGVLSPLIDSPYEVPPSAAKGSACDGKTLFVDCATGSDSASGASPSTALKTLTKAVLAVPACIKVSGGLCPLSGPVFLDKPVVIQGDGKTALSGGQAIRSWEQSPLHTGKVMVADTANFPLKEIKSLRLGPVSLRRSRWPKLSGDGLTTPNFLFAMPWSSGTAAANRERTLHNLGIDPATLPPNVDLAAAAGNAFVHVLGCVEKDVNSQMTNILSIGGTPSEPTASIMFRNTFTVNQRYYIENAGWELEEGEFFHDKNAGKIYAWPPAAQAALLASEGAIAPVTDQLLEVRGESVVVSNLTFLDTTYYADGFWDGPGQQPSDAAVRINFARNISIEGCNFLSSIGGYGVGIGNKTANSSVRGCLFDRVGQGGVFLYGFDVDPTSRANGEVPGNNTQPKWVEVAHNVISDIGQVLVHVAGIGLRSASHSHVHHNRISGSPRYGLQSDSFFVGEAGGAPDNSRFNLLEFNIISNTCRTTSDCGAVEMIGSGDPGEDGPGAGWYTASTLRYNNITDTVGSSSSDGKTVCVHGKPQGPTCRGLVWGVYLDGGQSGVTCHGNIIGATLHGAIFDNAGGNNTHTNNIFVGDANAPIMMDFGAPGASKHQPVQRKVSGSVVKRNIFYYSNKKADMLAAQTGNFLSELKPNGSDYNLYWSSAVDAAAAKSFPGGRNLSQWQGKVGGGDDPITCVNTAGIAADLRLSEDCSERWVHNSTDRKLRSKKYSNAVINIDCNGNYDNCRLGDANTRICLARNNGWAPHFPPPRVDNQGWAMHDDGTVTAVVSKKCLEVCYRGGAVGGCNGDAGSILQLNTCQSPPTKWQIFDLSVDGTLRLKGTRGLCVAVPPRGVVESMDRNSIVRDPLFVDVDAGNFSLRVSSPAFNLGFEPIPPIEAPSNRCGGDCLATFLSK